MIMVAILWSTGGVLIKLVNWNSLAIVSSKSLIAALTMLVFLGKPDINMSKPQALGAIFYVGNVIMIVLANKLTTAANVVLLRFSSPAFVAILSVWILKEKIKWYDLATILGVFGGMSLFFTDNINNGNLLGNIFAILAGFFLAGVTISFRFQKDGSPMETALLGNIIAFIITSPFMFKSIPDMQSIIIIVFLGVFQLGISYILYTLAIKHLSALEAILITVLEPILNPIWAFWILNEKPNNYTILGGLFIMIVVVTRSFYISQKNE